MSCLCPGAGTLLGNLFRIARVSKKKTKQEKMGNRKWRRAYVNSCANTVFKAKVANSFCNVEFVKVAEAAFRGKGVLVMGKDKDHNGLTCMHHHGWIF